MYALQMQLALLVRLFDGISTLTVSQKLNNCPAIFLILGIDSKEM